MKARQVVPRQRAVEDVEEAVAYYLAEAGEDVALRFIDALADAYRHLARHPATGSPRYAHELDLPGLRTWQATGFPYLVFYVEVDGRVEVWRVLHAMRDIPPTLQAPQD